MKLQMRAEGLDINLELNDTDNFSADQLAVLNDIKNLIETLSTFEEVSLSIATVVDDDTANEDEDSDETVEPTTEYYHHKADSAAF